MNGYVMSDRLTHAIDERSSAIILAAIEDLANG